MLKILCSPETSDVEEYISEHLVPQKKKILHIVPTLILYRKRLKFYRDLFLRMMPNHQNEGVSQAQLISQELGIHVFEMDEFLHHQIYHSDRFDLLPLTKRETSILVERVLANRPETNNTAWKSAIPNLTSAFFEFSQAQLSPEVLKEFEQNPSWQMVCELYQDYLDQLNALNTWDFGQACVAVINQVPEEYDLLILDGAFLPIKAKHHRLIENFFLKNKPIYCFIPYDLEVTNPAHRVLEKTYGPYLPLSQWESIKRSTRPRHLVVERLAEEIFRGQIDRVDDWSVEIIKFHHLEEEMDHIVEKAANYIKHGLSSARQIAIITPDPMEMRPMVRELAELYDLETETPKRPLAQLAQGRAIRTLYAIHADERIGRLNAASHYVDRNMISDLLDSGLLDCSEELKQAFPKMECFFEDVNTFYQWYETLDLLSVAKDKMNEKFRHHPLYHIPQKIIHELKAFIQHVEKLSKSLFAVPEQTITQHLHHLFNILDQHPNINKLDEELKERLHRLKESTSENEKLPVTPLEFAERISGILADNQYEEPTDPEKVKLLVTGPNNVEYQKYDYIFLSRFCQNRYPQPMKWEWPLNEKIEYKLLSRTTRLALQDHRDLIRYYLDRSMYYLYISILAAGKKLTITYSAFEEGNPQFPSHYLYDIANVFNITVDQHTGQPIEQVLADHQLLIQVSKQKRMESFPGGNWSPSEPIRPDERISLEEVAIYDYCARRFYYEKTYPAERTYTNLFQLQHYATLCLYEEAVYQMIRRFPTLTLETKEEAFRLVPEFINQGTKKIRSLFPIPQRFWEDVENRTSFHLNRLILLITQDASFREAHLSVQEEVKERRVKKRTFYDERQMKVFNPKTNQTRFYSITNLKTLLSFEAQTYNEEHKKKLEKIKYDYFQLLRDFWDQRIQDDQIKKLEEVAQKLNDLQFPKQAGPHCQYCFFYQACKEKEIAKPCST